MKTRPMLRRILRTRTVAGCLMLAGLLSLEAWFACSVARDWPRMVNASSLQAPAVDVGAVFGTR